MAEPSNGIDASLKKIPEAAGVYIYYNVQDVVIYVGKSVCLKRRVASYFNKNHTDKKTRELVSHIHRLETIQTQDEYHALLLENKLIKQYRPKYNIALKDDKGYPFLVTNLHHDFPGLDYHQGEQKKSYHYFGPYIAKRAVWRMLNQIQRHFGIRQCSDSFFKSRKRPCMLYQIKRCRGPCVGLVDKKTYGAQFQQARLFLEGKHDTLLKCWQENMVKASQQQRYEDAKIYRDLIRDYHAIAGKDRSDTPHPHTDVIAFQLIEDQMHMLLVWLRGGEMVGRMYETFQLPIPMSQEQAITQYLKQYYSGIHPIHGMPKKIMVTIPKTQFDELRAVLKSMHGLKVEQIAMRSKMVDQWMPVANKNLKQRIQEDRAYESSLLMTEVRLVEALNLTEPPNLIECFDISHTSGQYTIASCVVFGASGPNKKSYRAYNIPITDKPDDYASLKYVFEKRYTKRLKEGITLPDLIIVDGGKGQLHVLERVLQALQLGHIRILAISKGPERKPGKEKLHTRSIKDFTIHPHGAAFHLLMHIRNEAHRFAILKHRQKRDRQSLQFVLEQIPGIGKQKRLALYKHFGGLTGVKRATIKELCQVQGIHKHLAKAIHDYFKTH